MTSPVPRRLTALDEVVTSGLCIGCGLCESLAGAQSVQMIETPAGRLRPRTSAPLSAPTLDAIAQTCPGTAIHGLPGSLLDADTTVDDVWGPLRSVDRAYAADPMVRHIGATGGVLTALAIHLLERGHVAFIAHVSADPERPMRSRAHISTTKQQVIDAAGSRYGPVAPLASVRELLDRGEPFAFIGKPCDVGALRNLGRIDPRVDELCVWFLTLVCGGASELGKSSDLLDQFGLDEEDLSLFRYRGHGNPGPTRIETNAGQVHEVSYNEMWDDEASWRIQYRCKICPDAIGESADLAASDLWPGGGPTGEDEGFNGLLTRTARGSELVAEAVAAGALVVDQKLSPRDMDVFQPHQVRKKRAVRVRLDALEQHDRLTPVVTGLRIDELASTLSPEERADEFAATGRRVADGQFREPTA